MPNQILMPLVAVSLSHPPEYWRVGQENVTRIVVTLEAGKGTMGFYRVQVWEKQDYPEIETLRRDIYEPIVMACQFVPPEKIPEGFEDAPSFFDAPSDPNAQAIERSILRKL